MDILHGTIRRNSIRSVHRCGNKNTRGNHLRENSYTIDISSNEKSCFRNSGSISLFYPFDDGTGSKKNVFT